ncbi:MAG: hypothetical protein ACAH80_07260 [Alphaproteobacteria bacterium]
MTTKSYAITDAALAEVISQYCRDLTAEAASGKLEDYARACDAADEALKAMTAKANVCITSDAGMGSRSVLEAVAQKISDGRDVPAPLANARVLAPELSMMAAGAKFRGQLEERMKTLFEGLSERGGMFGDRKIVVAFDDLKGAFKLGWSPDTGRSFMFQRFAVSPGVSLIGICSPEFYANDIKKDAGLASRFSMQEFSVGNSGHTLAKAFTEGAAREISVRAPLVYRPKTPGLN